MSDSAGSYDSSITNNAIEVAIRLGLLLLLASWCFTIITPFILPVVWGVIIAVAIHPLFAKFKTLLGERNKLTAILYTIIALAFLITPTVMITDSFIETSEAITDSYQAGTLEILPPSENVKDWPVIGEDVYSVWSLASSNLEGAFKKYQPQLKKTVETLASIAASAGGVILQFILSIIISGILLANAGSAYSLTMKIFSRLTNQKYGQVYTDLSKATIRSVAQGVLGVAIIQAILSALGMYIMDVPAWGLWTMLILVLAIAQLPPALVLAFVCVYVFSVADTTPAVIFLIYCIIVSGSDGFLKPLFLGRGMDTPMLVILLGAIGGMIASGIIGLFIGAIILALGYELFMAWLNQKQAAVTQES